MVVVSLIAVVITKITIVNIEMKEVERGTKKNFYSADELMDNLRAGARELAEQSLEKAYADVLENYLTYSASGGRAESICHQIYGRAAEAVCRKPHRSGSWCVGYHGRFRQCGIPGFRL